MKKTIGIIGGAGPMAGSLLLKRIIKNCQKLYGCVNDYDYPKIILLSIPFSEMLKPNTELQNESEVYKQLNEALSFLTECNVDSLGIACNTLHGFLQGTTCKKKFINLIDETEGYCMEQGFSNVMSLCTQTSVQKSVYGLSSMQVPLLDEQKLIDSIINVVLSGKYTLQDSLRLKKLLLRKIEDDPSIDGILLGCTELSVLFDDFPIEIPSVSIIDPLEILSIKLLEKS